MVSPLLILTLLAGCVFNRARTCQFPTDWRPLSEGCRAELAEIIVFAKVLAIHQDIYSVYNYLPWQYETSLFYSAEVEMLCDQAWGSMLELPAGSRFNLTGLGYFSCQSHTVMENNSYFLFLRMDDNYNILPHGVNFQDAIFPDTTENRKMFSSLFQFANCTHGQQLQTFTVDWEIQEDHRLMCSTIQKALFEEEDRVKKLQRKVASLERRNGALKDKVKRIKRTLRNVKKNSKRVEQLNKRLLEKASMSGNQSPHYSKPDSSGTLLKV
ncbi:coiled-coil domain-containing protein 3a [Callorhinchus milii]|uniref:Coiled-coil domain containing 3a n=1 Tax=Callorhinchus milii TaxID=7868 RepID=A0A4W3ILM7_CALMI|nr:coiled-coil domain-containing protein 3a [Callorhinchus milii]|eukprot:gi/632978275/ref/XP_007905819.1/ PREDICTED: coiled-coil domain-containing protein 3 [Callorhinchus milii]